MKEKIKPNSNLIPVNSQRIYTRNLPHWEIPGSAYFITISTVPEIELADAAKEIVFSAIKFHDGNKYMLYACVVMTTHVHLVLLPLEETKGNYYSLAQIIHSIKSYTVNKLQKTLKIVGSIWLKEDYDRIIRDDNDFYEKMNYIMNNPLKAGLVKAREDYRWLFYRGID
jgi:putative transposase